MKNIIKKNNAHLYLNVQDNKFLSTNYKFIGDILLGYWNKKIKNKDTQVIGNYLKYLNETNK